MSNINPNLERINTPNYEKSGLVLKSASSLEWVQCALSDFGTFLVDHAVCERKAMATCLSFADRYSEKVELVDAMLTIAIEELEHFHQVVKLMHDRGITLVKKEKDEYVNRLLSFARNSEGDHLMDRLIVSALIEARGCERFALIGQHMEDPDLAKFYRDLATAEARHNVFFLKIAKKYFPSDKVEVRAEEYLIHEASVIESLPLRPILH